MHCVVTGGCGFIGSRLSQSLLDSGNTVTVFDNLSPQIHGSIPSFKGVDGINYRRADVRNKEELATVLDGSDAVFHLAAETGTGQSMYAVNHYADVNVMGTSALIEAIGLCHSRPRKVILASSRSVYGEGAYLDNDTGLPTPVAPRSFSDLQEEKWSIVDQQQREMTPCPTPENIALSTASIYAATKLAQEYLLFSVSDAMGFDLTSLRLQNVYGEGQALRNPYTGLLSIFFNRGRQGLGLDLYEDGQTARDFVHVDDVVNAFVLAAWTETPNGSVINIGSGQATTVTEVAQKMIALGRFDCKAYVSGQFRAGDIRCCYADISKAREILKFECRVSLEQGLSRLIKWGTTQPIFEDRSEVAENELANKGLSN